MITKTANLYLLKEAGVIDDVQAYLSDLNKRRIAAGYTAGNAVSKLGIGSKAIREELSREGLLNTIGNHWNKRMGELANWLSNGKLQYLQKTVDNTTAGLSKANDENTSLKKQLAHGAKMLANATNSLSDQNGVVKNLTGKVSDLTGQVSRMGGKLSGYLKDSATEHANTAQRIMQDASKLKPIVDLYKDTATQARKGANNVLSYLNSGLNKLEKMPDYNYLTILHPDDTKTTFTASPSGMAQTMRKGLSYVGNLINN